MKLKLAASKNSKTYSVKRAKLPSSLAKTGRRCRPHRLILFSKHHRSVITFALSFLSLSGKLGTRTGRRTHITTTPCLRLTALPSYHHSTLSSSLSMARCVPPQLKPARITTQPTQLHLTDALSATSPPERTNLGSIVWRDGGLVLLHLQQPVPRTMTTSMSTSP